MTRGFRGLFADPTTWRRRGYVRDRIPVIHRQQPDPASRSSLVVPGPVPLRGLIPTGGNIDTRHGPATEAATCPRALLEEMAGSGPAMTLTNRLRHRTGPPDSSAAWVYYLRGQVTPSRSAC